MARTRAQTGTISNITPRSTGIASAANFCGSTPINRAMLTPTKVSENEIATTLVTSQGTRGAVLGAGLVGIPVDLASAGMAALTTSQWGECSNPLRKTFVAEGEKRVRFGGFIVAVRPPVAHREVLVRLLGTLYGAVVAGCAAFAAVPVSFAEDAAIVAPALPEAPVAGSMAEAPEVAWQSVITSQIQAFRDHDAPVAFSYAGDGFQHTFPTPQLFFDTIIGSGYAPIMESRSHSFGQFQMVGGKAVIQEVNFVGRNQEMYGALYQLALEEKGWRVQGVQLVKQAGVAI